MKIGATAFKKVYKPYIQVEDSKIVKRFKFKDGTLVQLHILKRLCKDLELIIYTRHNWTGVVEMEEQFSYEIYIARQEI